MPGQTKICIFREVLCERLPVGGRLELLLAPAVQLGIEWIRHGQSGRLQGGVARTCATPRLPCKHGVKGQLIADVARCL